MSYARRFAGLLGFFVVISSLDVSAQVAAPVLSPASKVSVAKFPVTITGPTGSTVYYTSGAGTPGPGDTSLSGSGTVNISSSQTLQAVAVTASGTSTVTTGTYNVTGGLAMGDAFGMGLRFDRNAVLTFGTNSNGQLGNGTTTQPASAYSQVLSSGTTLQNVVQIAAGSNHGLAVTGNGTVLLWGDNGAGQLAQGTTTDLSSAAVGLTASGTLTNVKTAGGGVNHSVAVLNDGTVWASGTNGTGQIGINDSTIGKKTRFTQVLRDTATGSTVLDGVQDIAVGKNHTLALRLNGTSTEVWTWGSNNVGQLGLGDSTILQKYKAFKVPALVGMNVVGIGAGYRTGVAIVTSGTTTNLYGWGENSNKELGRGTASTACWNPAVFKNADDSTFTGAVAVCGGATHTLILKDDGTVWACGDDTYGQLGNGTTTGDQGYPGQVMVSATQALTDVIAIAAGGNSSMAIDRDGWIYTWGSNSSGQLCNPQAGSFSVYALKSDYAPQITNKPPTVDISSAFSASTGNMARANLTLTASPVDSDGTIAQVDFFGNGIWFAKAASPYTLNLTQLPAGTYQFRAVATDNLGAQGRLSAIHQVTVNAPTVTLQASATPISEGQTATAFTVSRGRTHPDALSVNLNLENGTASPSDYSFVGALSPIVIPANADSATVSLSAADDLSIEPAETVSVSLASGGGSYSVGTGTAQSVAIADRPPKVTVALTGTSTITETSGTAVARISLDHALTGAKTVLYTVTGSAVAGQDYVALSGSAVLASGSTPYVDIPIAGIDNLVYPEPDKTITLTVSGTTFADGTGWQAGTPSTVTVTLQDAPPRDTDGDGLYDRWETAHGFNPTIADEDGNGIADGLDDADGDGWTNAEEYQNGTDPQDYASGRPVATIALVGANSITETSGTAVARISLDHAYAVPMTVTYSVGGTAIPGTDYSQLSGTATLSTGSNPHADISITGLDDLAAEQDETITLTLTSGTAYGIGTPLSASVTLQDAPPVDSDGDGMFDRWETAHGFNPAVQDEDGNGVRDGLDDADNDGRTNQQEYADGTDPRDWASGGTPAIVKVGGDDQPGLSGSFLPEPLIVEVQKAPGTAPLANAQVTFTAGQGSQVALTSGSDAVLGGSLQVLTGTDGRAQVYVKMPADEGIAVKVDAVVNGVATQFTSSIDGLAGRWKLDGDASDATGHGHDGSITGTGSSWETVSGSNKALALTGNQTLVLSNNENQLIPAGNKAFSVAFWFRQDAITQGQTNSLLTNEITGTSGFRMGIASEQSSGTNRVMFWSSESGGTIDLQPQTVIASSRWYHAAVVYDGTSARCYLDGVLEHQDDGVILSNLNNLLVGNGIGGQLGLTGALNDLRIYRGTIDAAAVTALFNADEDANGIPDWIETRYGIHNATLDTDGDFVPDWQEYRDGTDPTDYFNGQVPVITMTRGDGQGVATGQTAPQPLTVLVKGTTGSALSNAPVQFAVTSGSGTLSASSVRTSAYGFASVTFTHLLASGTTAIQATAGSGTQTASVTFHISTPLPLSAPAAVSGTMLVPMRVALSWTDNNNTETGYLIEQRKNDETTWSASGTTAPNAQAFTTPLLTGTTTYHFRVRAVQGNLQSQYSSELTFATPVDTDGDGLPDSVELGAAYTGVPGTYATLPDAVVSGSSGISDGWLALYGLDPFTITGSEDTDTDGLSLSMEYSMGTDPTKEDTDGDGAKDGDDQYPSDDRRSEDMPATQLAVLDISGTCTNGHDVADVRLDDNGNAAFGFYTNDANGEPIYQAYTWTSGTAAWKTTVAPGPHEAADPSNRWGYNIGQLLCNGKVAATRWIGGGTSEPCILDGTQGTTPSIVSLPFPSPLSWHYPDGSMHYAVSETAYAFFGTFTWPAPTEKDGWGYFIYHDNTYDVFALAGDEPLNEGTRHPEEFLPWRINARGCAWGNYNHPGGPEFMFWDGTTLSNPFGTEPVDINDQTQVIGSGSNGGYLWQNGTFTLLQDLLPAKNQKQIRNIVPKLLSNQNPADHNAVHIFCEAESLEGPGDGQWITRNFILTVPQVDQGSGDGDQPEPVWNDARLPEGATADFCELSGQGVLAATGHTPNSSGKAAELLYPVRFECTDKYSEGFDPPLSMDFDPETKKFDCVDPAFWASVTDGGKYQTNSTVVAVFPNAGLASRCELVPLDGAEKVSVQPTTFSEERTTLAISGNNAEGVSNVFRFCLRQKGSTYALAELRVVLLPRRSPLNVKFYRVLNSDSMYDQFTAEDKVQPIPVICSPSEIVGELNSIMNRYGVEFGTDDAQWHELTIPFDVYPETVDHCFNLEKEGGIFTSPQYAGSFTGQINIILVRHIKVSTGGLPAGVMYPGTNIVFLSNNALFGNATAYQDMSGDHYSFTKEDEVGASPRTSRVATHEVGHSLTLSTRAWSEAEKFGHDTSPTPKATALLMRPGVDKLGLPTPPGRWLRHEDWKALNDGAMKRMVQ